MYAIVEIAGQQFKVEKDRTVYTHRLAGEEGAALVFDKVLLVDKVWANDVFTEPLIPLILGTEPAAFLNRFPCWV